MIRVQGLEDPTKESSSRYLIDSEWPRGHVRVIPHTEESAVPKHCSEEIHWRPQLNPSPFLRIWFQSRPHKTIEFRKRYFKELSGQKKHWLPIAQESLKREVELLYSDGDTAPTPAHFLKEFLEIQIKKGRVPHPKILTKSHAGAAVPVEKAIQSGAGRPLKKEMCFKVKDKLTLVSPEKRRVLR